MKIQSGCWFEKFPRLFVHSKKKISFWKSLARGKELLKLPTWHKSALHPTSSVLTHFLWAIYLVNLWPKVLFFFAVLESLLGCLHVCIFRFQCNAYLVAYFLVLFGPLGLLLLLFDFNFCLISCNDLVVVNSCCCSNCKSFCTLVCFFEF